MDIHSWLSDKLALASTILQNVHSSAVITIQSHARRMSAHRESHKRRNSGDYAFHQIMDGVNVSCWMTHTAYMAHIRQGFANIPPCYCTATRQAT